MTEQTKQFIEFINDDKSGQHFLAKKSFEGTNEQPSFVIRQIHYYHYHYYSLHLNSHKIEEEKTKQK